MKVSKNCIGKELEKPFPSNRNFKKLQVCVKDTEGNIVNLHFGDKRYEDFTIHKDEKRRASFKARHRCSERNDKTTPAYWACTKLW